MKKLEIGNFQVKDIVFGAQTGFCKGVLTINKEEAIAQINPEGKLVNIDLDVVRPGDSARILPVKAVVEPRFRPDGRAVFPGFTGAVSKCGEGKVFAMKNMCVVASGKYSSMYDGMIDMSGPAADHSVFSTLINLVVYAERIEEKDLDLTLREEVEQKMAAHLLAEYVAKSLEGQEPECWEVYELETGKKLAQEKGLPKVAYYMTIYSQYARNCNEVVYGQDCHNMMSVLVHPNEVFDGAVASLTGMMGQAQGAYGYQNQPTIKRLFAEHGKTINFMGVVLCPGEVSNDMKLAVKNRSGEIGQLLELDAAIIAEYVGGSNIDVDFFYHLAEMEDRGIKAVGIMSEHGGKMMQDAKGDAIISGGDTGVVIELPAMDKVIGDIKSVTRDYYYGSWTIHDEYGPSLREDGSLIINLYMIADAGNIAGFQKKAVREF